MVFCVPSSRCYVFTLTSVTLILKKLITVNPRVLCSKSSSEKKKKKSGKKVL